GGGLAYHAAAQEEPKSGAAALPPVKDSIAPVVGQRVDRFGDPLPDGLLHRFGSIRFRDADHMSNSAITADGRRLAVGSWKGVTVFDLETGKAVQHMNCEMENSWGGMSRLAITPDGTRVAHVMSGCQLGVRDVAS